MKRTIAVLVGTLGLIALAASNSACSSSGAATTSKRGPVETNPACTDGILNGDETGIDCGGSCVASCDGDTVKRNPDGSIRRGDPSNGTKDPEEADVDCGVAVGIKCAEGKNCVVDEDCDGVCNYAKKCVSAPSCKPHFGGDTCGVGEIGQGFAAHESCCRSLEVTGYDDPAHPGKKVYLDKYEITAGRVRAFIEQLAAQNNGVPNVRGWIETHHPEIWDDAWNEFLPTDFEGGTKVIARRLLGDPRIEDGTGAMGPGVILPPDTDQVRNMGVNYQFGGTIYVDLHGNNCGTYDGSWGFPTYWYPPALLTKVGEMARADGIDFAGQTIPAKDHLDVKAMNCISNAMLAAFCAWDGGQLATNDVLDYVTTTPKTLGLVSGCGSQYDDHGELLDNKFTHTVQTGGRCPDVRLLNATFDAGTMLPVPGSPLNDQNYHYPDLGDGVTHDKSWQVAAPGRAPVISDVPTDVIRLSPGSEGWADLAGNLNEAAFEMSGASFTGRFALKFRGLGYGSSRSILNVEPIRGESVLRVQRPEAKAAYAGGRCMRFK